MSRSHASAAVDHWRVLGLAPGADGAALKRAFRQQARRWHPDLNGNDPFAEERFKQINEAYAVLSDPRRRLAWEQGADGAEDPAANDDPFARGFPDFEDYLDVLFGRSRGSTDDPSPDDTHGATGSNAHADAEPSPPPAEAGEEPARRPGRVATAPASPPPVQAAADLETIVDLTPDQALHGTRLEVELADGLLVELATPPLAGDGWRLRLAGVTPGGGDHFLHLRVRTVDGLRIDGLRVLHTLDLTPADAALGCQAVVPTLEGPVRLRVPAGSSSGRLLRLRGRGLADGERVGDQLVQVRIVVPADLPEADHALYRRLRELQLEREDG